MKSFWSLLVFFVLCAHCNYDCNKMVRNVTQHEVHSRHPYASKLMYTMADQNFTISLKSNREISQRGDALRVFTAAANTLNLLLGNTKTSGPIVVSVGMSWMEYGVIGATHSTDLVTWCESPRGVIPNPIEEKSGMTFPTCSLVKFEQKTGISYNNKIRHTKAHMKVLGYTNLDDFFGEDDGTITFSTRFMFDYDLSDGVSPEYTDFFSVCIHELMHLLGFVSGLDNVDYGATDFTPTLLDFARFRYTARGMDFSRDTRLANPVIRRHMFYIDYFRNSNKTGVTLSSGYNLGDGNQASHWGANEMYGKYIGAMDPTLAKGDILAITINDLLAFRMIGYSVDATVKPLIYNVKVENNGYGNVVVVLANFILSEVVACDYGNDEVSQATALDGRGMWVCIHPQKRACKIRLVLGTGLSSDWIGFAFEPDCHL